jgi:pimeloyl-ACP methyl ester carboxylesterase
MLRYVQSIVAIGISLAASSLRAEKLTSDAGANPSQSTAQTLGGEQFWADELLFHDWRIQRNVITKHCRLLDADEVRHASGTFEECERRLDEIKAEQKLAPMSGRAVILIHGLGRGRSSMAALADFLKKNSDYTVLSVGYPSLRAPISDHAAALARVLDRLDGVSELYLVGHSMGNLVVRHYLADCRDPASGRTADPRIKRMVMLGAPNQGAQAAQLIGRNKVFESVMGDSGRDLARGWEELEKHLACPSCEFGIVAGGRGDPRGYNPLLDGDDDLVVRVEETRLAGARDFLVVPVFHALMMRNPTVQVATLRFLEHGYFVAEDQRQPIE